MPIKHPVTGETLYSVEEAAPYMTALGLQTSVGGLNSLRSNGDGPPFLKIGKRVWYRQTALYDYVLSKITDEASSTSEMRTAKNLLIEDQSAARSNGGGER
jgi:hypothetical protein